MWWWLSFADGDRPPGSQWLGCALVRARSFPEAHLVTKVLGINPGGELRGAPCPAEDGDPPEAMRERLITDRDELDRLTVEWTGKGTRRWPRRPEGS